MTVAWIREVAMGREKCDQKMDEFERCLKLCNTPNILKMEKSE